MKAVILADKYSKDTTNKIVEIYRKQGINDFIICRTSDKEQIEEKEYEGYRIIDVKLDRPHKTGGQILKIANLLNPDEPFFLTYGDYLCNADLKNLISFHKKHARVLSMVLIKCDEKQLFGGYMLVDYDAIGYIDSERVSCEKEPVAKIAEDNEIGWYMYRGSYQVIYQHMKIYGF